MQTIIMNNLSGVVFIIIAFFYIWLAKWISDKRALSQQLDANHAIAEENNVALAMRRAGLYLAITLGMYGAIIGPSHGLMVDITTLLINGALITLFIFIAQQINDKIILPEIKNTQSLKEKNLAVGFTEFGAYIATGIIAMASFTGEGGGVVSSTVFFIIGQIVLIVTTMVYEKSTSWNVKENIYKGNTAAGILLGSIMIAISIAIYGSISGDFNDWSTDLLNFVVSAGIAIILLIIASKLIDPIFLTATNLTQEVEKDENCAAVIIVVAIKIAAALMINAAVI
ncbi:MAG: DUF350 domain-containing protein [Pseudomonadota bacterium]